MARGEAVAQLTGPTSPPGGSMLAWLGAIGALTLLATAGGAFLGLHLAGTVKKALQDSGAGQLSEVAAKYAGDTNLRELPPIIVNLADPADARIRLQASIVFDGKAMPKPDVVAAQIAEDILGFLRTLSIAQLGGASGLQHLREDLNERAAIRSDGLVRELILQTLVVQ